MPALDTLTVEQPSLAPLGYEQPPHLALDPVPPITIETPETETAQFADIQLPPPQTVSVPAFHSTETHNTETREESTEIVQNITIHQQPGESTSELVERLKEELRKEGRAFYYD